MVARFRPAAVVPYCPAAECDPAGVIEVTQPGEVEFDAVVLG
ncbi:hypothetical protein [Streptomyces peucetius]